MRTEGMEVKQRARSQRVTQGEETKAALLEAARGLFGEAGYAATSLEDVVARAGVTKGALYHHFGGKAELFQVVYEQVKREVSDEVVAIFLEPDPWQALLTGSRLMIEAQLDPAVRRIALHDARSVLDWETIRAVETRYGTVGLRGVLRRAVRVGAIDAQPLRPLALLVSGAIAEACFYVADAVDPAAALEEATLLLRRLLEGLRPRRARLPDAAPDDAADEAAVSA
jgi:AcrR family transcriptional regulator